MAQVMAEVPQEGLIMCPRYQWCPPWKSFVEDCCVRQTEDCHTRTGFAGDTGDAFIATFGQHAIMI